MLNFCKLLQKNFNSPEELTILIEIQTKEDKAEMETHQVTAEVKISK